MAKKAGVQATKVSRKNMGGLIDHFSNSIESGNALGFGFGGPDGDVWVDFGTGDVDVTHPDGSVEKIAGDDPMAEAYWNPFGYSNE